MAGGICWCCRVFLGPVGPGIHLLSQSTTWNDWRKSHICVCQAEAKEEICETNLSTEVQDYKTHMIQSLSSWSGSESSKSFYRAIFFFFNVSPIKSPSLIHRTLKGLGTVHVRKPWCRDPINSGTRRPCSWELWPQDPMLQKNFWEVTVPWHPLNRALPIPGLFTLTYESLLFLNPSPQQQIEAVCKWEADFQYNEFSLVSGWELKLREMWQCHQVTQALPIAGGTRSTQAFPRVIFQNVLNSQD